MPDQTFMNDISRHIWESKYRFRDGAVVHDRTLTDTWHRVANALAAIEPDPAAWEPRFYDALADFKFLPGGRIQAGAGTDRRVTLFNCFVMGTFTDSIDGIFDGLKEGALTMQQGGGVGYDFSTLRPQGSVAHSVGAVASGPVSFMQIWDAMCATLLSTGARRGAMMATLRCDHPDIEAFIEAKQFSNHLSRFNLSVLVTDEFMQAVRADDTWALVFPLADPTQSVDHIVSRRWSGAALPVPCQIVRRVRARQLWEKLMRANYDYAEPGVIFIDRINRLNNLWYREQICATNPCGEIPLPPYGACNLGSINLVRFVHDPLTDAARLEVDRIRAVTEIAVRMMDNVIDLSRFPLERQAEQARGARRIGLGVTGLADALILLGLHYARDAARVLAAEIMATIRDTAYRTSIAIAREKGPFPFFDAQRYLAGEYLRTLPPDVQESIRQHGIRNSHLIAIAPTGTISLLANNVSSGIEPVFDFHYRRHVLDADGRRRDYELTDYACDLWDHLRDGAPLPRTFVSAQQLDPTAHLAMQAAIQPYVDNSISKTINVPVDYPFESFKDIYQRAFDLGLKGCTTFRPNTITGAVLSASDTAAACCTPDREAD